MLRGSDVQQLMEMKREGLSTQAISKLTGYDRKTVRKYLLKPEAAPRYGPRSARPSKLDSHKPYLQDRMKAGVWNAQVLLRELRKLGYQGGYTILKDWLQPQRAAGMATAVRRFETPPGKHYGECRVMVRGGGDLGVLAHNRRREPAAALHKARYRASSHLMRLEDSWGVGAGVAWGPFVEPSALRFMSRSAWT